MHLFRAPFLAGIILVEADEIAIVAFIKRHVPDRLKAALAEFLNDPHFNDDLTEEEIRFLRRQRFGGRRPTKLYYYRALQNLRDPLHFRQDGRGVG